MIYLHALSTAVPEAAMTMARAADLLCACCTDDRTARRIVRLLPHTGIQRRHLAVMESQMGLDDPEGLYQRAVRQPNGPTMDARSRAFEAAADRLLTRLLAPMQPDDLAETGALVTVSCTHASSPGLERAVFAHSAVPHGVDRWNLGFMGCSAALAALRLAHQTTSTKPMLAVAGEFSSLHFQYSADLEQLTANLLFADGAAAVLTTPEPSPIRIVHATCTALPAFAEQMVWWAGDFGLRLALSPELPATLAAHLPAAVERTLREANVPADSIDHWLVHPGGPQILDVVTSAMNLPAHALDLSRDILRNYGNMSSPTILFILRAALEANLTGRTMLLAFGPGLTVEAALLDITEPAAALLRGPDVSVSTP